MLMAFFCYALPAQADQLAEANDSTLNDSVLNDSVLIDGDKLELHLERNMRATGRASMRRGQQSVSGDVIDYDLQNDELHVTGNVAITLDNAKIEGSELRLQLSSQLGEFKNARFSMLP
jgi:LPS-assembly protein